MKKGTPEALSKHYRLSFVLVLSAAATALSIGSTESGSTPDIRLATLAGVAAFAAILFFLRFARYDTSYDVKERLSRNWKMASFWSVLSLLMGVGILKKPVVVYAEASVEALTWSDWLRVTIGIVVISTAVVLCVRCSVLYRRAKFREPFGSD